MYKRANAKVETGPPIFPPIKDTSSGLRTRLFVDQLDHAFFPRNGYFGAASVFAAKESMGSDITYTRMEGETRGAASWGSHTLNLSVSGGTTDPDSPPFEFFSLGGPLRLSGYRIDEIQGRNMALGRLMYYRRAVHLPELLGSGIYTGASLEAGKMGDQLLPTAAHTGTLWAGSVFLGADTFLGPFYFGLGFAESGRKSLYLLFGVP
jgi:NTE family protein